MVPSTDANTTVDTSAPPLTRPLHTLPAPFTNSSLEVLTQGAEALVYRTTFITPNTPCVLKYRPPKPYRHPILDKRLTKARLLAEARVLVRCRKEGVKVPAVLSGDWEMGWLVLEWIEGRTVRVVLDEWVEQVGKQKAESLSQEYGEALLKGNEGEKILDLMGRIGRAVGRLHEVGICHGDLTTSNLMLRPSKSSSSPSDTMNGIQERPAHTKGQTVSAMREAAMSGDGAPEPPPTPPPPASRSASSSLEGDIILIDFGLAQQSTKQLQDEDRAVDLYVLERAFAATHPSAEPLFQEVLRAYGESYKGGKQTLKKLADVRLRGRKRSMLG